MQSKFIIDINNVKDVKSVDDFANILFDNYMLDTAFESDDCLVVYANDDREIKKLVNALKKFGTDVNYIDEVINNKIEEHKNIKYNMKYSMNEKRRMAQRIMESRRNNSRNYGFSEINEAATIREMIFNNPYDPIFEAASKEVDVCKCKYNGKLISKMDKVEKRDAKAEIREAISELKKLIREAIKAGRPTKMLENKLEKLQKQLDCLMDKCEETKVDESVNNRFARMRKIFEASEEKVEEKTEETTEEPKEEQTETTETVEDETEKQKEDETEEYDNVELDAVVLSVAKKNVETVKAEMIEAGVAEDDIDVDETEDDDEDVVVDIKISIDSLSALNTYLEGVGIDLAEELGGELIFDGEAEVEEEQPENDETIKEEPKDETTAEDDEFDDSELNDLF